MLVGDLLERSSAVELGFGLVDRLLRLFFGDLLVDVLDDVRRADLLARHPAFFLVAVAGGDIAGLGRLDARGDTAEQAVEQVHRVLAGVCQVPEIHGDAHFPEQRQQVGVLDPACQR